MSRVCDVCGRTPQKTIKKSHANNKMISRNYLNLQTRMIEGIKKKVCTRCIRTIKKRMA